MESLKDLEQEISQKMSDFYEKELGLRPSGVHTAIQGDLIIIRFENVLSPSEINLITQESGKRLIKEIHELVLFHQSQLPDNCFGGIGTHLFKWTRKAISFSPGFTIHKE